ncbi:hypothetical protein GCM10009868_08660 [Terrabacter aerolatus]|uniref:Uncharacterized protein n=1 Tax=Terrabacter aerolatus TaxID=422442 RepID=A0A512D4H5_9MICO|nr:hypothetical protein TAE01_31590 [Terrabacter aerolatus]
MEPQPGARLAGGVGALAHVGQVGQGDELVEQGGLGGSHVGHRASVGASRCADDGSTAVEGVSTLTDMSSTVAPIRAWWLPS